MTFNNPCPHGRRYYDTQNDDACRMCEYRDDCPIDPDDFDPMPDCIDSDSYYDDEDRDITKRR